MNREPINEINNVSLRSLRHISTIMSLLLIISIACSLLVRLKAIEHRAPRLEIYSSDLLQNERGLSNYTFIQNSNLTLTCAIVTNEHVTNMSFTSPRSTRYNASNFVTLQIENVNDGDTGMYECRAQVRGYTLSDKAFVRIVKESDLCRPNFSCLGTRCIFPRFLCDGVEDCPNGEDESPKYANCSLNPCENKILCGKRCVPPHWCCMPGQEDCNVTHIQACCLNPGSDYFGDGDVSELRRRDDGFLETTIYVVIGCATAFMVLIVILVIAICRSMKLTSISRPPRAGANFGRMGCMRPPPGARPPAAGMGDFDVYLNQALLDLTQHSGLLVTYNINNGVQIMGRPVDPPPYCEVVSLPPRGGPPPPYVPNENMTRVNAQDCEDAANSEDDALLGDSNEVGTRVCGSDSRPVCGNDVYLPPSSTSSRSHQTYSRAASHESMPSGSDQTLSDVTVAIPVFQPALDDKFKATAESAQTTPLSVVADESSFKQICASSLPVHQKDAVGK